jgi:hypothetical protein
LGENLDKSASQIMGYAGVAGVVEWIVLTDGNEYRIYNAHAQVPVNQKLFKRVVLASDEPDVLGTLLLLSKAQLQGTVIDDLWRQYFVDRQVRQAVESLSGIEPPTDFLRLIRKRVPALSLSDVCARASGVQPSRSSTEPLNRPRCRPLGTGLRRNRPLARRRSRPSNQQAPTRPHGAT